MLGAMGSAMGVETPPATGETTRLATRQVTGQVIGEVTWSGMASVVEGWWGQQAGVDRTKASVVLCHLTGYGPS